MEIRWLGNFTFEVRSSVGVVIVDYEGKLPSPTKVKDANTVFVYSGEDDEDRVSNDFQVLTGPGEYEIGGLVFGESPLQQTILRYLKGSIPFI